MLPICEKLLTEYDRIPDTGSRIGPEAAALIDELVEAGERLAHLVDRLLSADPQEQPTPDMLDQAQRELAALLAKARAQTPEDEK